jgi:hypothetical protein
MQVPGEGCDVDTAELLEEITRGTCIVEEQSTPGRHKKIPLKNLRHITPR